MVSVKLADTSVTHTILNNWLENSGTGVSEEDKCVGIWQEEGVGNLKI